MARQVNGNALTDRLGALSDPTRLRIIHLLRAMEYTAKAGREVTNDEMEDKVGQAFSEQPSVFNFYLPGVRRGDALACVARFPS